MTSFLRFASSLLYSTLAIFFILCALQGVHAQQLLPDSGSKYAIEGSNLQLRDAKPEAKVVKDSKGKTIYMDDDNDDDDGELGPPSKVIVDIPTTTPITETNPIRFVIRPGEFHVYKLNISQSINPTRKFVNYYATGNVCDKPVWDMDAEGLRIQLATNITDLTQKAATYNATAHFDSFDGGFANVTLGNVGVTSQVNSTAYLAILAPEVTQVNLIPGDLSINANDTWTYEVGLSTGGPLHEVFDNPNLYLVDTDYAHALFVSGNMTDPGDLQFGQSPDYSQQLFSKNSSTFYGVQIFKSSSSSATSALALDRSFCALHTSKDVLMTTENSKVTLTTRGPGGMPKLQYFFRGLNKSESYVAYLTETTNHTGLIPNTTQIFGGKAFAGVNLTTKAETNCQIIYNLELCSDVAFAVPGNTSSYSAAELAKAYDDYAKSLYDTFNTSMQVVQCGDEVDASDRYSILRTCDDCKNSYRQWLCATTIPRCTDSSIDKSFLFLREQNQSRTDFINNVIQPGVYKEILPCIDLCHGIMQDCPSSFQFQCPQKGLPGFYGAYFTKESASDITCNFPGVVYAPNGASRLVSHPLMLWACLFVLSYVVF